MKIHSSFDLSCPGKSQRAERQRGRQLRGGEPRQRSKVRREETGVHLIFEDQHFPTEEYSEEFLERTNSEFPKFHTFQHVFPDLTHIAITWNFLMGQGDRGISNAQCFRSRWVKNLAGVSRCRIEKAALHRRKLNFWLWKHKYKLQYGGRTSTSVHVYIYLNLL